MPARLALIEKLNILPVGRLAEVEDFVDFLHARQQDRGLTRAAGAASGSAFGDRDARASHGVRAEADS